MKRYLAFLGIAALASAQAAWAGLPGCAAGIAGVYKLPVGVLAAVHHVEGGRKGLWVKNTNGTHDRGLMQINTWWDKSLSRFGISSGQVANDDCMNVAVAAWILRQETDRFGNWPDALAAYNAGAGNIKAGREYARKVLSAWAQWRVKSGRQLAVNVRKPIIVR